MLNGLFHFSMFLAFLGAGLMLVMFLGTMMQFPALQ